MPSKKVVNGVLFEPPEAEPRPEPKPGGPTTRELWRLVNYYLKNIRHSPRSQLTGVIRNIQRVIDKGIGLEDIARALENYANDEFRKSGDPRFTKSARSFFTEDVIQQWQTPRPKFNKPVLPEISFVPTVQPEPAFIQSDEEEESDEL